MQQATFCQYSVASRCTCRSQYSASKQTFRFEPDSQSLADFEKDERSAPVRLISRCAFVKTSPTSFDRRRTTVGSASSESEPRKTSPPAQISQISVTSQFLHARDEAALRDHRCGAADAIYYQQPRAEAAKTHTTIPLFGNISSQNLFNFYGEVSIGTPPQKFKLLFETEEVVLWIPNFEAPASRHSFYDHSKSSSYEADGSKFVSGDMLCMFSGFLSRDTIRFGDFTLSNVSFAEATIVLVRDRFADLKIDGMFGLGAKQAPNFVLQRLLSSDAIGESVFAFYFRKNKKKSESPAAAAAVDAPTSAGELTIGAIDKRRYTGDIHYVSTLRDAMWMWTVLLDGVTVEGGKTSDYSVVQTSEHTNRATALISPSFPLISASPEEIEKLAEAVGADGDMIDCSSEGPDIVFHIGGAKLTLKKDDYTIHDPDYDGNGDELCRWAFKPDDSIDFWWIGQPFLQKFYTVFDFGDDVRNKEPRLGFALAT